MAQARPGAPPPLEHPSNRPPTACGSYKRRDQTTIAGETRPAELETPVRSYPRPAHGGVRSEGMRRTKRLISMLPKLTKKEVNPRDYGTGVAAQSFFSTHDMMCMALQGHWPSLKRLLRESSGPEAELELPDHPSYPNPLLAEAVCEFRFASRPDAPWKPSGPGDFFKAVQPNYPRLEPITEQTLELIIAPDGVPAQRIGPSQVRFRLSHVSERFFITVTGGVLSLSALRPYPGWAS